MSCSSFQEAGKALRNEKTRTTDEFLIERRGPLSIPPDASELPKPKNNKNQGADQKSASEETKKEKSNDGSKIENIFLEEMRKN